ncbi:aquaporin-like protein [Panaeolus papilionaceus]|nr:aquaporin-like protein [Panaeolus papilionaceus]
MATPLVHLRDIQKRMRVFTVWERKRNSKHVHWAVELFAEAFGVFLYVYFGTSSAAGWVVGNIIKQPGLSNILQIGLAYAFGILFAISICASTSGGHFNPCVTTALVIFKGFPPLKAIRYVAAQLLGSYIACLLVYNQWKELIDVAEATLMAAGPEVFNATQFTPNGPPGIFALYLLPGQTLSRVFLNEFVNCFVLAIIIWAALDPSSYMMSPMVAPWVISIAYACAIWGFATPGISLNAARDLGARFLALTVWGLPAGGGSYAAITALTNIPATLLAVLVYEIFLVDSDRVVTPAHLEFMNINANHRRVRRKANGEKRNSRVQSLVDLGEHQRPSSSQMQDKDKGITTTYEYANGNNSGIDVTSRV